jgi:hypothetical protein
MKPDEVMFVGDWKDDLLCGGLAKCVTCLKNYATNSHLKDIAHLNIDLLEDLITLLETGFHLEDNHHQLYDPFVEQIAELN